MEITKLNIEIWLHQKLGDIKAVRHEESHFSGETIAEVAERRVPWQVNT